MKIAGVALCGPGEAGRYMEQTLKEFNRLCDVTVIVRNNAGEEEAALIKKYGAKGYEDNRERGRYQRGI